LKKNGEKVINTQQKLWKTEGTSGLQEIFLWSRDDQITDELNKKHPKTPGILTSLKIEKGKFWAHQDYKKEGKARNWKNK